MRGGYEEGWAARLRNGVAVGTDMFIRRVKHGIRSINRERSGKRELRFRHSFAEVMRAVERVKGEAWDGFADRHGDWGRDLALQVARECTGLTLQESGRAVGGLDYGAVSAAVRRMEIRRKQERAIKTVFNRVLKMLNI